MTDPAQGTSEGPCVASRATGGDSAASPADHFVLVYGTMWANARKKRVARMIGTMLADAGLGLVTGSYQGVDRHVADAFAAECEARGLSCRERLLLVAGGHRFGALTSVLGYRGVARRLDVASFEAWKQQAVQHSHAAVMVGGGRGALDIARRLIERGRPVFPIPFVGGMTGNSDAVFQDILRTWDTSPVPGVTRSQYLRLAEPWISGTGPLADLLLGTLMRAPDVFVSYRRSDAPAAAGRIAAELAEEFGRKRVFLDVSGIAPSNVWSISIEEALRDCKVGVVVIGRGWLAPRPGSDTPRLWEADDVVQSEIRRLLDAGKIVLPILVEGARLPEARELPEALRPLLGFQAIPIDNALWETIMRRVVAEIRTAIGARVARPDET